MLRNLSDRSYEKRKLAALEVEKTLHGLQAAGDTESIRGMIGFLANDYVCSINSNNRKGGLIGLAAVAIGLMGVPGRACPRSAEVLLRPGEPCAVLRVRVHV